MTRCQACGKHGRMDGYQVCEPCSDRYLDDLTEVAERYDMLDANPGKTGDDTRGAPGFRSQAPGSVHVMSMRDPRSKDHAVRHDPECEETTPPMPVFSTLRTLCDVVIQERALRTLPRPATVPESAAILRAHHDWIMRSPDAPAYVVYLNRLCHQLRRATGWQGPKRIGKCIEYTDDDRQCGAPIYMPAETEPRAPDEPASNIPPVQCGKCGSVYDGRRLIVLRLSEEAA